MHRKFRRRVCRRHPGESAAAIDSLARMKEALQAGAIDGYGILDAQTAFIIHQPEIHQSVENLAAAILSVCGRAPRAIVLRGAGGRIQRYEIRMDGELP